MQFDIHWLSNPEVFSVGEMDAFSDHGIYATREEAEQGASSLVRNLDGVWRANFAICPADAPDPLMDAAEMEGTLQDLTIPCEFQMANPTWDPPHYTNTQYPWDGREALVAPQVSETYNPTVTLVKQFTLSEQDCTHQLVLTFGAVEAAMALWVNGTFVGYAEDSFTPHHFDISAMSKAGENRIVLQVFKRCTGSWMEDQDFWRFSGIHRSVTLTLRPKTHLRDIFVKTPLTDNYTKASLSLAMKLDNPQGVVALALQAPDGNVILGAAAMAQGEMTLSYPIPNVKLWSAEEPNLYTLFVTLQDADGNVAEVSRLEVGFRQFEMIDKIMCLNGKRIVFHGVNRHEFDCDRGRVMTDEILMQDIRDIKGMNVNAIRTCHYPNDSRLYKLCDKYGLYVIDETNMETHGSWAPMHDWVVPGDKPEWQQMVLHRGRSMLERDKNHACILLWSCGNESWGGKDIFEMSQMFRQLDDTRLVHYEGVANDPRYPDTTDVLSRMYFKVADIEHYLNHNPQKPFVNCEYTHAMGNSCGGMSLYTALEDRYPMYQGGFIWDYVDQALRTTAPNGAERLAYGGDFGDRPCDWQFNTNGIILGDRSFTPKVQEVRYLFRDITLLPSATGVTVKNRKLFAPLEGLTLRCQVLVNRQVVNECTVPMPPVKAGEEQFISLFDYTEQTATEEVVVTAFAEVAEHAILPAGHVLSYGQQTWNMGAGDAANNTKLPEVVLGDSNVGAYSQKLSALFGRGEGGIYSFRDVEGKQCLLRAPKLSLFRAYTDNDHGNKLELRQGVWHLLSRYCYVDGPEVAVDA